MKLKVRLVSGEVTDDIVVTVDANATVGQVAERLRVSHPRVRSLVAAGPSLCLRVSPGGPNQRTVGPDLSISNAGIRSGDSIALTNAAAEAQHSADAVATLKVVEGPDAGRVFNLPVGSTIIGRERNCHVRLSDPLVSKRHARVNVTDMVEIIDDNSANGVFVGDEQVQRSVVSSSDAFRLGDTVMTVLLHTTTGAISAAGHSVEFNRSPRLDPRYEGIELVAPEPPGRPQPQRFPLISMFAPLLMGALMFAITKNALSILFIALSPLMMLGSYFENRRATAKAIQQATQTFRSSLRDLAVQLQYANEMEREQRRHEHPAVAEVAGAVRHLTPLVWTRRPEHRSFGDSRLGLGTLPSRNTVKLPQTNNTLPELWKELHDVAGEFRMVDRVPVVASLSECGNVGVAGPAGVAHDIASATVAQYVGLHSPAELVLAAVVSATSAERWNWLKWLPHSTSDFSPLACEHLAATANSHSSLIASLEDLIANRSGNLSTSKTDRPLPLVLVVVQDEAAIERARLVRIIETGPVVGVHTVWVSPARERLPAACRTYVEIDANTLQASVGFTVTGQAVRVVEPEPLSPVEAEQFGRLLSPAVDAGALLVDESDLPRSVSFLTLTGTELGQATADVIEQWRGNDSLPPELGEPKRKGDSGLRALVGQDATDRFYLDLRSHGPHALVGGTTGAGKSEFLQSWILGMATAHAPSRVNFLFVDYKGGAAFADCVKLPHSVGLVTDLSPHLVRRALRSLTAELRYREHLLNGKKAKDLLELERRRDPECPPSLVIIVDEFAALVNEVPEFVDGVVNVAQRGRSLGLHLILATQRPAGVIKDNLRANTNLRVALRMADESDSDDVIGTKQAATFDPSIPGRAIAKTGPGRLTVFQSAYVGGHTTNEQPAPGITVAEMPFGVGRQWEVPEGAVALSGPASGPNDIRRLVTNVDAAARELDLPAPRKPWLPELASTYRLEQLPSPRTDTELVYGVVDRPDEQAQPEVAFCPDRDGNMAVIGTGGSGKSTVLRSLAIAAGFASARGGPCHVYALDYGSRGLSMLEPLPPVGAVIYSDDTERTMRLLRMLRATIDERAERYARLKAGSIVDYRQLAGSPEEARILLMVDNLAAFRQAYELNTQAPGFDLLESIAADGRAVGVHVVLTADRAGVISSGLASVIGTQLALRLTAEMDFAILGVPADVFSETSPPGRGFLNGCEVQVAAIGGERTVSKQSAEVQRAARAMAKAGVSAAPPIARLPEVVELSDLNMTVGEDPSIGLWDETLAPLNYRPSGVFVVAGPAQSGRSTAVRSMVAGLQIVQPSLTMVLFGPRRSALADAPWTQRVTNVEEMVDRADALIEAVSNLDGDTLTTLVVLEAVGDLVGTEADDALQRLVKAMRNAGQFVIAEGETATLTGWGLLQLIKSDKHGLVLQPDSLDGDTLFGTSFPRVRRADFVAGRGFYVRGGRYFRVQVPLVPLGRAR